MNEADTTALTKAEPRTFVRLDGLPFHDGPTDWHVNNSFAIATGDDALEKMLATFTREHVRITGDTVSHGIILQRADASEEWLAFAVSGGEIAHAARMRSAESNPHSFGPDGLSLIATAEDRGGLDE